MAKWHGFGRCKTRLSKDIGKSNSAKIQSVMTKHTISVAKFLQENKLLDISIAITGLGVGNCRKWSRELGIKKFNLGGEQSGHILSKINNFSGDGILTALQISKYCKKKNINLNDWLQSSFEPFPQKLTNIKLDFNIKKLNPKTKILIDQTIENFQALYSDNCRVYIRPSGTEPLIRVLVEAKNHKKVYSLSSEIQNKLLSEIDKIMI